MTLTDGTYTAVIDRIEQGADEELAVLVVEVDDETAEELIVTVDQLPEAARTADTVLTVTVVDGEMADATVAAEETEARAESAQDRFGRLSQRLPDEDDS